MESSPNKRRRAGYGRGNAEYGYRSTYGYGSYGGYGGYGSAYGYPGSGRAGESALEKSLNEYRLILQERIWYVVITFVVVVAATAGYTFSRVPDYRAQATVEILHRTPTIMNGGSGQTTDSQVVGSMEDLNTQVNILKSEAIIESVATEINGRLLERFLAPYTRPGKPMPSVVGVLGRNRDVVPERLSLIIDIQYRHPDRTVAAAVANLFADAFIAHNAHLRVDESLRAVQELQQRADEQRKKVDDISKEIQDYREKNNSISLDQRKDIVTEKLKDLNKQVTDASAVLQEAKIRLDAVAECRKAGRSCLDLPFIASNPNVTQLEQLVATQTIAMAQLGERYRAKHPQMIMAAKQLNEAQRQLQQAIDTSVAQVEAEYQNALRNYTLAEASLTTQVSDSLKLDRYGLPYEGLERELDVDQRILAQILDSERLRQEASSGMVENEGARIVDRALPPGGPYFPDYTLNLSMGAIFGLSLGIGLAFFVAFTDDRVKSAFDIETVMGLALIGIIPEVRRLGSPDDMERSLQAKTDREVTEAFSTLLSSLQLKEESKRAQCILTTSTVAGEGKTFLSTHLAQTYAAHGEKVVVVDCDLRRPAVHRVFHLENLRGVIDIVSGSATLDEVIVKNVSPNLDVLPTGGRSKNPTQTLNSKEFALMISELRKRYDRIFIDTPPVAIVSDAFIILPVMDGSIYAVYFNKVKRQTAQYCAQRILETTVPNFGAVLNGLSGGIGGYYYAHYYDRSYKDYYVSSAESANGEGPKVVEKRTRPGPFGRS